MRQLFASTDVETTGPIPGVYSMLSFGTAVFDENGILIDTFSANLEELPGSVRNPPTMEWWKKQQTAWENCRENPQDPKFIMTKYCNWLKQLDGKLVFVGYPASFDSMFIFWYLHKFTGECPFGFSTLDIKSYAMAILKTDFSSTVKRNMPKKWFSKGAKHSHVALEDAIEQGYLFFEIFKENLGIIDNIRDEQVGSQTKTIKIKEISPGLTIKEASGEANQKEKS